MHRTHGVPALLRVFFVLFTVVLAADVCRGAAGDARSHYADVVRQDAPVCWWRMSQLDEQGVANEGAVAESLLAASVGKVKLEVAGPSGEEFPDFAEGNLAMRLSPGKNFLRVADPGQQSPLDFDNGDALTIEAWIEPQPNPGPTFSYIVGKGRTLNPGTSERNQNYSLRLANRKSDARLSFFFVDGETPDAGSGHNADGHRWTSKLSVPLDGRWHHVALTYTFGKPDTIRGYIDGEETRGSWDLAGPTTKRPVVDDDDLWIGSSMAGRATFPGAIDEVAIYRRALDAETIRRHVRIQRRDEVLELVKSIDQFAPDDHVQYDVFEGVAIARSWKFVPTDRRPLYASDVFALTEFTRKYDDRGVIVDRPRPLLVQAYARVTLPPGRHKLALRSLNAARLYIGDELLAETPFLPISSNGHGKMYQLEPSKPDRLSLAAGHHEQIVEWESDGTPRVISVLAVAGLSGRPAELGELVVAVKSGQDGYFQLLGAGSQQSLADSAEYRTLNDAGWLKFLERDLEQRRRYEALDRKEQGRADGQWWARRHAAARKRIDARPPIALPPVEHSEHVANEIDRFIQARVEAEGISPAPVVDDLAFLRRASLDVIGVIPTPAEIEQFLADPPAERRRLAIDRLLANPGWADHWVGYWQHVLAENPGLTKPTLNNSGPFRWYLHESLLDNKPLDRMVTELVMMEGGTSAGGPAGFAKATNNDVAMAHKAHIIGTAFLGVEMKCARCHDAPSHESKQKDLFSLAAMLARKPLAVPKSSSVPGTPEQLARMAVTVSLEPGVAVKPAWPFDDWQFELNEADGLARDLDNPRAQLAFSLVHPDNRRFGEVFVNRLWKRYFGRGLVEPIHDWEDREPSHPKLLAYLADELVRHNYDVKHVARLILESQAYQRSFDDSEDHEASEAVFAAATRRRLSAEQVADSLFRAVGKPFDSEELCVNPDGRQSASSFLNFGTPARAWEFVSTSNERERPSMTLPRAQSVVDLLMAYGWQQNRQEPVNERVEDATPLTPLVLANGEAAARAIDLADHGALVPLCLEDQPVEQLVDRIVLRFLGRQPSADERSRYVALLAEGYDQRKTGQPPQQRTVDRSPLAWSNNLDAEANRVGTERVELAAQGDAPTRQLTAPWRARVEDLVWVLVNSPEFVFVP